MFGKAGRECRNLGAKRQYRSELPVIRLEIRWMIRKPELLINNRNASVVAGSNHDHRAWVRSDDVHQVSILPVQVITTLLVIARSQTGNNSQRSFPNYLLRGRK